MATKRIKTTLESVPGLGPGKRAKLLAAFGGDEARILSADPSELRMWVSSEMARRIHAASVAQLGADVPSEPEDYAGAV